MTTSTKNVTKTARPAFTMTSLQLQLDRIKFDADHAAAREFGHAERQGWDAQRALDCAWSLAVGRKLADLGFISVRGDARIMLYTRRHHGVEQAVVVNFKDYVVRIGRRCWFDWGMAWVHRGSKSVKAWRRTGNAYREQRLAAAI